MGTDNGVLRPDLEGIAARAEAARAVGTPYPVPHQILATAADLPAVTAYALQLEAEVERLRNEKRGLVLRAPDEDAASVAKVLRTIADRCERYWNAEASGLQRRSLVMSSDPSGSRTGERAVEVLPVIGANEPNRWTHLGLDQPQRLSGPGFDHIVECAEEQADWEADDE